MRLKLNKYDYILFLVRGGQTTSPPARARTRPRAPRRHLFPALMANKFQVDFNWLMG
jgi:hypothetical protein